RSLPMCTTRPAPGRRLCLRRISTLPDSQSEMVWRDDKDTDFFQQMERDCFASCRALVRIPASLLAAAGSATACAAHGFLRVADGFLHFAFDLAAGVACR